ncbi:uncharacterized protein UMAG_04424 [Mycosarcoma maydis]|uniref:Uncharacterized protein n=1 Tax=Mycosarcoma maydis TaxID=5270 RepID=A0A0D1DSK6_MYCMD|nr:uncharacterized protein UMAG_04424 [Ustilago maydis 521]KIS67324.1 hypothetical protein UMAG_04424 [Ustilago maydis 521]|eukprot:XP_011391117.1 hypothetical protein UMAG_04424 [Ustilago maydis 521]
MEPALPLPLRLDLSHPAVPTDHTSVSHSISQFLSSYAARTGTSNSASHPDETATSTTGGVVAAQLTRLMNGLAGKIDYDAFESLLTSLGSCSSNHIDELETPVELLQHPQTDADTEPTQFSPQSTPATQDSSRSNQDPSQPSQPESPSKKSKKDKKHKKDKKDKKNKNDKKDKSLKHEPLT